MLYKKKFYKKAYKKRFIKNSVIKKLLTLLFREYGGQMELNNEKAAAQKSHNTTPCSVVKLKMQIS